MNGKLIFPGLICVSVGIGGSQPISQIEFSQQDNIQNTIMNCGTENQSTSRCDLSTSDILGPYYIQDAPIRNVLAGPNEQGQRLIISGDVLTNGCADSIPGTMIEVWQADDAGCYSVNQDCSNGNPDFDPSNLRGKFFTDNSGSYNFETVLPGFYEGRPRHIHIRISLPSGIIMNSQIYFEGDPFCESDPWCGQDLNRVIILSENDDGTLLGSLDWVYNTQDPGLLTGDANWDGEINVLDIVTIINYIVSEELNPTDFSFYLADVNQDYSIDVLDIVILVSIIIG
ncbi:MAG: hypothetical protein HQ510_08105 [Candidatus Marinimicrobia bacterium]|nr:hypothetical protein [Candidatus Neomarinimicrobiota bacterium]